MVSERVCKKQITKHFIESRIPWKKENHKVNTWDYALNNTRDGKKLKLLLTMSENLTNAKKGVW